MECCLQDRKTREIEAQKGLPWSKSYYMPTGADRCLPSMPLPLSMCTLLA